MTNPDNVGGLLPCPFCGAEPKLVKCVGYDQGQSSISCANCDVYMMDIHSHVIETWNRRELCRAAPAGGDAYHALNRILAVIGANGEIDSRHAAVAEAMETLHDLDGGQYRYSAPAGSGEVTDEMVEAACDALDDACVAFHRDGHPNASVHWKGFMRADRNAVMRVALEAALLRKLQQGAE